MPNGRFLSLKQGSPPTNRPWRPSYTLIEVLLALAIVMTMVSLVWPSLTRLFVDHQLKSAVDRVRVNLSGTRLHALNSSQTYQFRFEPYGQKYIVIPHELQEASVTQSTVSNSGGQEGAYRFIGQLPENMTFQPLDSTEYIVERLSADWVSGLASSEDLTDVSWSTPVLFYPDGTATEAEFQIVDSSTNQLIRLYVRGLTGAVRVSRVEMEDTR